MGKQFGAIYLILGTCIAAGMLGLPIVTAQNHFLLTIVMMMTAYIVMTAGSYYLLQVTLRMQPGVNMIKMSGITLGKSVKALTSIIYLLLLYSLICAYLAVTGDVLQALLAKTHLVISRHASTLLTTVIMGFIVSRGIRAVDFANRGLMTIKVIICFLVIISVIPFVSLPPLNTGQWQWHFSTWLVMITAFGYGPILPSIRDYLQSDRKQLTRAVMIGGLVPLTLYLIWVAVIQGALPHAGSHGLIAMNDSPNTNSLLINAIASLTHHPIIKSFSAAFIFMCAITGFLSVSLSLNHALADELNCNEKGWNQLFIALLTFVPPAVIVIADPAIFIHALSYAGIFCLYILVILPVAMWMVLRK